MRCFVAIELPDDVKRRLAELQDQLGGHGRAVRWVRPESVHLTVKFLGDVPDARLPAVCRAVSDAASLCEPFEFAVRSAGCFPPRGGVRVVWVGVEETSGKLAACQSLCEDAFADLGFAREARKFVPHLTLGRVKDPRRSGNLRDVIADYVDFQAGMIEVSELILFESRLRPQGAQHTPVHRAVFPSS